jgi:hypothetical protein
LPLARGSRFLEKTAAFYQVPFLNLIGLWVFAFVRWPTTEKAAG